MYDAKLLYKQEFTSLYPDKGAQHEVANYDRRYPWGPISFL